MRGDVRAGPATLAFFTTERAFFITELTEEKRRATEYCYCLGELRAPRELLRGAMSLPPDFVVLRGPQVVLRVLRGKEGQRGDRTLLYHGAHGRIG